MKRLVRSTLQSAWLVLPLVRAMVGPVLLLEGLQRFIHPSIREAARFESMGFPAPKLFGYFVVAFEIACGPLILLDSGCGPFTVRFSH